MEPQKKRRVKASLAMGFAATLCSFGVAWALFALAALQFAPYRKGTTGLGLYPGLGFWILLLLPTILIGALASYHRKYGFPSFVAVFISALFAPLYAWSGPDDMHYPVLALITLRMELVPFATGLAFVILYWVRPPARRERSRTPESSASKIAAR